MPTFVQYERLASHVRESMNTDTLKWALTNTAPDIAADTVLGDITEISAGGGYSAGGVTASGRSFTRSGDVATLAGLAATVTASGGTIGPFSYAVLYNDTQGDELIGYIAVTGAPVTLSDGQSYLIGPTDDDAFTVTANAA